MFIQLFAICLVCIVFVPIVIASTIAAPPLGTKRRDIKRLVKLARITEQDTVYDLGCGDGRLLLAVAKASTSQKIIGLELSPLHIILSRMRILLSGQQKRVAVQARNFYNQDLSRADVILCFLTPKAMEELEPKFKQELKPGTRVVSYVFPLPNIEPAELSRPSEIDLPIYLYRF